MYKQAIDAARHMLTDGGYTCVFLADGEEYCSKERGVKPLITLLSLEKQFDNAVAADKTVGAGAAHLYVLLGVRALWANVISDAAIKILEDSAIEVFFGERVPHIINRRGDGICPIESAVEGAESSREAYERIIEALDKLRQARDSDRRKEEK